MAAYDFGKFWKILDTLRLPIVDRICLGSWNCDTVHKRTYSYRHTHAPTYIHTILHRPTLELATLIRTDRAPRPVQTPSGHSIKVLHTTPSPNPQQRSDQTHCHPHMTAGHHKIRYAPSPPSLATHPPNQIWT